MPIPDNIFQNLTRSGLSPEEEKKRQRAGLSAFRQAQLSGLDNIDFPKPPEIKPEEPKPIEPAKPTLLKKVESMTKNAFNTVSNLADKTGVYEKDKSYWQNINPIKPLKFSLKVASAVWQTGQAGVVMAGASLGGTLNFFDKKDSLYAEYKRQGQKPFEAFVSTISDLNNITAKAVKNVYTDPEANIRPLANIAFKTIASKKSTPEDKGLAIAAATFLKVSEMFANPFMLEAAVLQSANIKKVGSGTVYPANRLSGDPIDVSGINIVKANEAAVGSGGSLRFQIPSQKDAYLRITPLKDGSTQVDAFKVLPSTIQKLLGTSNEEPTKYIEGKFKVVKPTEPVNTKFELTPEQIIKGSIDDNFGTLKNGVAVGGSYEGMQVTDASGKLVPEMARNRISDISQKIERTYGAIAKDSFVKSVDPNSVTFDQLRSAVKSSLSSVVQPSVSAPIYQVTNGTIEHGTDLSNLKSILKSGIKTDANGKVFIAETQNGANLAQEYENLGIHAKGIRLVIDDDVKGLAMNSDDAMSLINNGQAAIRQTIPADYIRGIVTKPEFYDDAVNIVKSSGRNIPILLEKAVEKSAPIVPTVANLGKDLEAAKQGLSMVVSTAEKTSAEKIIGAGAIIRDLTNSVVNQVDKVSPTSDPMQGQAIKKTEELQQTIADHTETIAETKSAGGQLATQLQVAQFADNEFALNVEANTDSAGMSSRFLDSYPTKEAAVEAGVSKINAFVDDQLAQSPEKPIIEQLGQIRQTINNIQETPVESIETQKTGTDEPITQRVKDITTPAVKPPTGVTNDLIKEAGNYATVEEFISSKLNPPEVKTSASNGNDIKVLYHGTSEENAKLIMKNGVINLGSLESDIPNKIFLTSNIKRAREFGNKVIEVRVRYGDKHLTDIDGLDLTYDKPLKISRYTKDELTKAWDYSKKSTKKQSSSQLKATKEGLVLEVMKSDAGVPEITKENIKKLFVDKGNASEVLKGLKASGIYIHLSKEELAQINPEYLQELRSQAKGFAKDVIPALTEYKIGTDGIPEDLATTLIERGNVESLVKNIKNDNFSLEKFKDKGYLISFDNGAFSTLTLETRPEKPVIPAFGRKQLKELIGNSPEFAENPTLTVVEKTIKNGDVQKRLQFVGKDQKFEITASALGLDETKLKVGDTITLDPESLKIKGEEIRVNKYEGGEFAGAYASKGGGKTSTMIEGRVGEGKIEPFKISQKAKEILESFGVPIRERDLSSRYMGLYKHQSKSVRVQHLYDLTVVTHEATHAIDDMESISKNLINSTGPGAKIRRELTRVYDNLYPTGSHTDPLKKRIVEGLASFIENYFYDPSAIKKEYPLLVDEFIEPSGSYYNDQITKLLDKMNGLVDDYAKLTPEERIASRIRDGKEVVKQQTGFTTGQRLVFEVFNQFEPLNRYASLAGVRNTWKDPTVQAFNILNKNSLIAQWVRGETTPIIKPDGNFDFPKGTVKDYLKIVSGKEKSFSNYLTSRNVVETHNRMMALRGLGAEDEANKLAEVLSKDDFRIQDAQAVVDQYADEFQKPTEIFDAINDRLIDLSVNTGLMDSATATNLKIKDGYTSFRRYMEDDLDISSGRVNTTSGKVNSFKERKGSALDILDPVYNQIQAIGEIIGKGMENVLWTKVRNLAQSNVQIARRFEKIEAMPAVDAKGRLSFPQERDPNIVRVWNNGKREFYKAAPEFIAVAKVLHPKDFEGFAALLRLPSSVFTRLTTSANPFFAAGNLSVDQFSALAQTKTKLVPVIDPVKAFIKMIARNPKMKNYFALGGKRQTLASFYDLAPENAIKKLAGDQTKVEKLINVVDMSIGVLELPSNVSEIMTRFSEYQRAVNQGKSMSEAMYLASEVTTPFQLHGNLGGRVGLEIVKSIPYFNAALEVLYKFARATKDDPGRVSTVGATLLIAAIGSAIATMKSASDKQKRYISNVDARELARGLLIPLPDGESFVRLRIPEQFGSISAIAQLYIFGAYGENKASFDEYLQAGTAWIPDQLNITEPKKMAFSWLPQVIKPSIQTAANTKTYPDIMPIVPYYTQMKSPSEQYTTYTSKVAKTIGNMIGASPMLVDFWVRQQFGAVGGMLLGKLPANPTMREEEEAYIVTGRTYNTFYEKKQTVDQQWNSIKDNGDASYNDKYEVKQTYNLFNDAADQLSKMRDMVKGGQKLPENVKQEAYDLIRNINEGKKLDEMSDTLYGLSWDLNNLK